MLRNIHNNFQELYIVKPKTRVTSPDKQASIHVPRFGTQSKQSSKQPFQRAYNLYEISLSQNPKFNEFLSNRL